MPNRETYSKGPPWATPAISRVVGRQSLRTRKVTLIRKGLRGTWYSAQVLYACAYLLTILRRVLSVFVLQEYDADSKVLTDEAMLAIDKNPAQEGV